MTAYVSEGIELSGSDNTKEMPLLTDIESSDSRLLRALSNSEISAGG